MGKRVAIVGATGAVGLELLKVLAERAFPVDSLALYASERSAGTRLEFAGDQIPVQALEAAEFKARMARTDVVFFSAGASLSKTWVPVATASGAVVVDNSSAFRMQDDVPLVVPEVNPDAVRGHKGIIANPNCSTAILVLALAPIHRQWGVRRAVVATYQAVSGTGRAGIEELRAQTEAWSSGRERSPQVYPVNIAFNLIPLIGDCARGDYSTEELKLHHETRKILGAPDLHVSATCVRVPVWRCHSEAVVAETERPAPPEAVRHLLQHSPGVRVLDDPAAAQFPVPAALAGTDGVQVGRIRADLAFPGGVSFWVVGDQLRKGAATNAVQIAELL